MFVFLEDTSVKNIIQANVLRMKVRMEAGRSPRTPGMGRGGVIAVRMERNGQLLDV